VKLVNINPSVVQVQADDATPLGHLKHINGLWKFKALGYDDQGDLVPGGGPLTGVHNAVFETLDPTAIAARLFPATSASATSATPTTPVAVLQARGLCFAYPQQAPLFDALNLDLLPGVTCLQGGDGRGKTTLLRLLAGELPAQAGQLELQSPDPQVSPPTGLALHREPQRYRQQVCWIDPRTTEFENISAQAFFESRASLPPGLEADTLKLLIAGLSLTDHLDKPLYMLSTGSKRKVWLSAALASRATLTLLDDPFAALDQPSIRCVIAQLKIAAQSATRACVVAHYEALADVPLAATLSLGD
jgi:ABC-type transport system involved in cytochrome c biogenesis ATPase subunit